MNSDIPLSDKVGVESFVARRPSRGSVGCVRSGALHMMRPKTGN